MDIVLSGDSQTPIYDQIYSQISSQIISGQLKAGEQLPPIRTIANELRVSVIPVKMAWEKLDKDGFISTVTGRGTFVANVSTEHIQQKVNTAAQELVKETVKKAKIIGLPLEELLDYIKKEY